MQTVFSVLKPEAQYHIPLCHRASTGLVMFVISMSLPFKYTTSACMRQEVMWMHFELCLIYCAEFGLACHLGVLSGLPCVGVAKNLLQVQGVFKSEEHQSQVRQSPL